MTLYLTINQNPHIIMMKDLEKRFVTEQKMMELVLTDLKIGWWKIDFKKNVYSVSNNIRIQLGLEDQNIPFELFFEMIRPDYRAKITKELKDIEELYSYDNTFPIICTNNEEVWIHIKLIETQSENEKYIGSIQIVSNLNDKNEKDTICIRNSNLQNQLSAISQTLLAFLHADNRDVVFDDILKDILKLFKAGGLYIVEYDCAKNTQTCFCEVVSDGVNERKQLINQLPLDTTPWWTEQISKGKSIILSDPNELPIEAAREKEFLISHQIKSLIVVPLFFCKEISGYIGFEIEEETHNWSVEDIKWLTSLLNIIGLCFELNRLEQNVAKERDFMKDFYMHMPIAHMFLEALYDDDHNLADYRILSGNKELEGTIGYPCSDHIGAKLSTFHPIKDDPFVEINEALKSNINFQFTTFFAKTGKYCKVHMYFTNSDKINCFLSDVTDVYKTNEALDNNEKLLRNIFDNIQAGIELYDSKGYLIDLNIKDQEIFGVERKEDMKGISLFENPNFPKWANEKIRQQKKTSIDLTYSFNKVGSYYKSVRTGSIEVHMVISMLYDKHGDLTNYILTNTDQTKIKNAYNRIGEFERTFSLITKFGKIGYCKFNFQTQKGYAMAQWYHNLGENIKTPISDIIPYYRSVYEEDRQILLKSIDQIKRKEITCFNTVLRVVTTEGIKWIRHDVMRNMSNTDAETLEMISVNYDITELKQTENELIKAKNDADISNRLKSAFLANMSHEIRTPLNAIVGFSELLSESDTQNEKDDYMKIVHDNNNLLLQLISDILDLSKIEAGTLDFSHTKLSANQLCSEIVSSSNIKSRPVKVMFEKPMTDFFFLSDINRLKQVITNFINNAFKFTTEGQITLGYHLLDDGRLKFYVQDSGCGIPSKDVKLVFDRFVKLNTFVQGTGLGLSICKSIINQLKGEIGADSEVGKGSCFWFILPKEGISCDYVDIVKK